MDVLLTLVLIILRIIEIITQPIYWYYSTKKHKVSSPNNPLLTISATKLSAKIRRKEVSSEEVVQTFINRIKEVNPIINAVVQERYDDAIKEARYVDQYLSKSSMSETELAKSKPLLGVPLTVKESCSLQGLELSTGLISRSGYKADADGKIVARLRTSGAIPLLVSNTPELCLALETSNKLTGRTNNPYDSSRTAGGSSGGEGALLGAAASVIGIGSDLAGSIRIPAHYNGVFGHKLSPRIASIKGHYPLAEDESINDYLVIGPMVRYAEDLKLMMNIIVDPQMKTILKLNEKVDLKKLNIFFMEDPGATVLPPVHRDIKRLINTAVKYLNENCGCTVQVHKFTELKYSLEICQHSICDLKNQPGPSQDKDVASLEIEYLKSIVGKSKYSTSLIHIFLLQKIFKLLVRDHKQEREDLRNNFISKLKNNGVFLYPTLPISAPIHNKLYFNTHMLGHAVTANSLGLPATHVPCGLDKNGLPIGFQVMAAPNQDRLCLAVAEELEKCFGGWMPP